MEFNSYGRTVLKPVQSNFRKFLMMLSIGLVWNALTGLAIYAIASQWTKKPQYIAAVVLLLFAAIGLFLIYGIVYRIVAFLSPLPAITVNTNEARFGGRIELEWAFKMPQLVKQVEIWLTLDENEDEQGEAGPHNICVFSSDGVTPVGRGQTSVALPESPPNSYIKSRKFEYGVQVKAKIKYLPDIDQEYVLLVGS